MSSQKAYNNAPTQGKGQHIQKNLCAKIQKAPEENHTIF